MPSPEIKFARHSSVLPESLTDGKLHVMANGHLYLDWGDNRIPLAKELPDTTISDEGKFLRVKADGSWDISDIDDIIIFINGVRKLYDTNHFYGVLWDKTTYQMRRLWDAEGITLDTSTFACKGEIPSGYNNPFDSIYPWSECKQCNVDLDLYRAQVPGDDLTDAVVAWYGDPDFIADGSNGFVGRYTPEFWHFGYETDYGKVIVISDKEVDGFIHHYPSIRGIGFAVDDGNSGVTCDGVSQPLSNIAVSTIHTSAKNSGFTIGDIYEYDANMALYLVEYANMSAQRAIGESCDALYYEPNFKVLTDEVGATSILVPKAMKPYCVLGATLDFGASKAAVVLANRRTIVSVADEDDTYCRVTFTPSLDVTTAMYPSIHGKNCNDSLGNKSGFIGVAGKNNAYYRGAILFGNRWQYTLGCARQTGTGHIWLCPEEECDNYDTLNTSVFTDTGITLFHENKSEWKAVGDMTTPSGLSSFGVIKSKGNQTEDSQYVVPESMGDTVSFVGGNASLGSIVGVFCVAWSSASSYSVWSYSASPLLKTKF